MKLVDLIAESFDVRFDVRPHDPTFVSRAKGMQIT